MEQDIDALSRLNIPHALPESFIDDQVSFDIRYAPTPWDIPGTGGHEPDGLHLNSHRGPLFRPCIDRNLSLPCFLFVLRLTRMIFCVPMALLDLLGSAFPWRILEPFRSFTTIFAHISGPPFFGIPACGERSQANAFGTNTLVGHIPKHARDFSQFVTFHGIMRPVSAFLPLHQPGASQDLQVLRDCRI